MAHIVSFEIEGLVGRTDVYAEGLRTDVNIFFGLNGSGKTSLLKILHSAMENDSTILERVPFSKATVSIYSITDDRTITRRIDKNKRVPGLFPLAEEGGRIIYRTLPDRPQWISIPDDSAFKLAHQYLPTWRLHNPGSFRPGRRESLPDVDWDEYFASTLDSIWARYSNDLLKAVQKIQADGLTSILRNIFTDEKPKDSKKSKGDTKLAYNRVAAFLRRQGSSTILGPRPEFDLKYRDDLKLRQVVDDISQVEGRIEQALRPRNKLESLISSMFSGNKELLFGDKGIQVQAEESQVPLAALSSGEKQALMLLIHALLAEANSLIIDEPELSLHIDWQRSLVASMSELNPNAQLIIATHSPEIMAEVQDECIYRIAN